MLPYPNIAVPLLRVLGTMTDLESLGEPSSHIRDGLNGTVSLRPEIIAANGLNSSSLVGSGYATERVYR